MSQNTRSSGIFDRFAAVTGRQVERPWFFMLCALFVGFWIVGLPVIGFNSETWHLWLNSPTTSITFLLVALLQNTTARSTKALHHKLDALAEGMAQVLDNTDGVDESGELAHGLRDIAGTEMEQS